MASILTSLGRTVAAGFILLLLIVLAAGNVDLASDGWQRFVLRWLHVMSGILWIGLLWYFNFVQIPSMPKIPDEHKPAIGKVIAPTALFWFRWAAAATVGLGLLTAIANGYAHQAFTLQPGVQAIGIGMWLALVMAFNVWFIIWPNQQKILGLVPATPEQKAAAAKPALYASRFNTMFSIGMLYFMVAQQNVA